MKIINRIMATIKFGGIKLIFLKLIDEFFHEEKVEKYLYNICRNTPSDQIPYKIELFYCFKTGCKMDIKHPITFNEKIQWMKAYDSTEIKTKLADKLLVREYVKERVGEEYLIPLIGVWDSFDDINFDKLPTSFVLKANHGSGWNIIVKDKNKFNMQSARQRFNKWMNMNFAYVSGFEMHYKNIVNKIAPYILLSLAIGAIMYLTVMKLDDTVYLSESFRSVMNTICGRIGIDTSSEWWNTGAGIRWIGHVIEYFALGLVVGIAVKRKLVGVIVCMAVSFIDQTVKIFIPARHFDWGDIPFDIIGFCCGLAIAWVVRFAICKLKEEE